MSLNVIALGGNAILDKDPSDSGQKAVVAQAAKYIADFVEKAKQVICVMEWPTSTVICCFSKKLLKAKKIHS